jgi:hypothetical protein
MPTSAKPGSKCVLKRESTPGSTTFNVVAEVKGVRGPSLSGGVVDVTSFDSAGVREFVATLRDAGTLSFTVNYIPNGSGTGHQLLAADTLSGVTTNFRLEFQFSPTVNMAFSGIVTNFEVSAELEQAVSANVTIKITGWPVWT